MSTEFIIGLASQAVYLVLEVSAPMLILGLVVGLIISIFQATTQIQEQTLAFVPKIVAVLLALLLFGPWIVTKLIDFTSQILGNLYMYIG
ncbi:MULTISPECIES: flagellar biosynthesis protein FliQ [Paenibacillus]|jgi:flagellar biosynthetic protein FliQ|uniref:Flagellar biosynthetic protein FliQ n=1 Tax=Paenibacillus odorifer TaxID=189426 RepID=A0ABX3GG39_9BACL|nr:flagellar biosynthesis protein FliQ [Paenibacillus odorifer]MEC0133199.1 flagellar biosynthesis protein FliQ [Paenibacillus odorifer]MEC0223232.1 flagellar biosynthesis protein FliQ [Paenibacillus odorifer]OMC69596.1 EscS/YscS/HrcS family type III secretion system export apparatus protein [Paenibacillus odorifer]OMC78701.1 EscS/YscS/HrcS family type III secretion system export apparatus protein [Paenibacillus odorifer]OMD17018.1 EscS/YscS/HrcS family type III secretion system export apparat